MFGCNVSQISEEISEEEAPLKKQKLNLSSESKLIHSSLSYSTITAPPIIEYNSIESYNEKTLVKSLARRNTHGLPSTSGLNNLRSVSSPIVLKQCKAGEPKKYLKTTQFYEFFSIEELSLVTSLRNWINTKVSAVGVTSFDSTSQQCHLNSLMEIGSWNIILDTSLLVKIPPIQRTMQVFGTLHISEGKPMFQVNFFRVIGSIDLPLFIESYKLMQRHVTKNITVLGSSEMPETSFQEMSSLIEIKLNDTLDDYDFSLFDKV